MNQLLLGAVIPFLIGILIYMINKFRASLRMLVLLPAFTIVSMLWAVAPDLPRLLGMQKLYHQLSLDPRCNIFYWHYSIDMIETDSKLYLVGFLCLLIIFLTMAWRELYIIEKEYL